MKGVTLYGAIGNCLDRAIFMTGVSTNKEEFKEFVQMIKANLNTDQRPTLVLDNHAAHVS